MADTALSGLTATTTLASGDLLYVVDGGSSRKIDWDDVVAQLGAATKTLTNTTLDANGTGNSVTNIETADLAAGSKSGADATLVTGTAGTDGNLLAWNADGDAVDSGSAVSDFATAAQGALADSAQQPPSEGAFVNGDKTKLDSAVQPGDNANTLGSGGATDGYVLTADGAGNAAWEAASGGGGTPAGSTGQLQFNDGGVFAAADLWQGTNVIEQRNSTNAQTFNIYNTYDGTNDEWAFLKWNANVFEIGTDSSGTGTVRSLSFLVGGSQCLSANSAGNITLGVALTSTGSSLGSTAIGRLAVASAAASVSIGHGISSGTGPEATGTYSFVLASGYASRKSTASGDVCSVFGGSAALADKFGQNAYGLYGFGAQGDAQISTLGLIGSTADATPTEIFLFGHSNQRAVIPANKTWAFVLTAVARSSGGTDNAMYVRRGIIKRDGANNTALVGSVADVYTNETDASWDIAVTADDTNESLKVEVTGAAATGVRWVVKVELTEVAYA